MRIYRLESESQYQRCAPIYAAGLHSMLGRDAILGRLRRHCVAGYFIITFAISWSSALAVVAPTLIAGRSISKMNGLLLFPAMIFGPALVGVAMTVLMDGTAGLGRLSSRMRKWKNPVPSYATALLFCPLMVVTGLWLLQLTLSASYKPNFFLFGLVFGIPAGFLEEIGWTGYVFSKMYTPGRLLNAGVLLGVVWSAWHFPVIDFLGAATPHGAYLIPFALAFTAAMTAVRVIICFLFARTGSVLIAQLFHATSTGSLVVFGPRVDAAQEVIWYTAYAALLWTAIFVIHRSIGLDPPAAVSLNSTDVRAVAPRSKPGT